MFDFELWKEHLYPKTSKFNAKHSNLEDIHKMIQKITIKEFSLNKDGINNC